MYGGQEDDWVGKDKAVQAWQTEFDHKDHAKM